ncbi:brachyurin-like [Calliphora vicina]|uniref:brachyurin-like n=1 Tax=Calliphora vicina TaxID=7373 RepID=UPI00325B94FA
MYYRHLIALVLFAVAAVASQDLVEPLVCNGESNGRIVNGNAAVPKQIPYQVGLIIYIGNSKYWCGGSLISNIYVATAGHCAKGAFKAIVLLGATNIDDPNEVGQIRITVNEASFIVHEDYDEATLDNDIALIRLTEAVVYNEYISNIKLPKNVGPYPSYAGEMARISGWGKESSAATNITNILRYADVCIQPNFICYIQYFGSIKSTNICAYGLLLKATCNGDSGGPLAFKVGDDYVLIGIVSFGFVLGCDRGWSSGFTRVTSYMPWIYSKTGIISP